MKLRDTKINIQKSLVSLRTNKELSERNEIIPFTIATERIQYLGINLGKEVKDPHTKNCKIVLKKTEDDPKK